jgi:type IV pilus assembly protein PilW
VPFAGTALVATEGGSGVPDAITVRYEVQDGGEANCLGNTIASGLITFVFTVDQTLHQLNCSDGLGGGPVVVMDNIDDMQITYGVDTNGDGAIDSYQTATGLTASQVAAVRVSLLVRGPSGNIAATNTQTYAYNGASVTATDGVLRQVYTSTFTVRNQAH